MEYDPQSRMGRPVRAPKTAELIAAQIRGEILRKRLAPGTSLPTEPALMAEFGVSRPTLRQAYRILEAESLIHVRRGIRGGAVVLAPDIRVGARYMGVLLQFADATIADVYEARTVLEPICAAMMAERRDPDSVRELGARIDRVGTLIAEGVNGVPELREWSTTTYLVHDQVLKGSGNTTLAIQGGLLAEVVATHYATSVTERFGQNDHPERFRKALLSYRKLARLVAAGNTEGAQKHWLTHMQTAAKTLLGDDVKNKRIVDLFD